ncbi:MAG: hypothetical protein PHW17_07830 [Desulfobacterales bacterium]|nr:hypothetical protein [Desulfobacterales bacterium]MDD3950314.1 hypothetical protein [Desulfobacterales bacterium]
MSNHIDLYWESTTGWTAIERTIRSTLQESGAPVEITDSLCAKMKDVFEQYSMALGFDLSFDLPSDLSLEQKDVIAAELANKIGKLAERIHAFKNQALLDRLILEIELCGANP